MYVYMYIYIHTYIYFHMYAYIVVSFFLLLHSLTHESKCVFPLALSHTLFHLHTHIHTHTRTKYKPVGRKSNTNKSHVLNAKQHISNIRHDSIQLWSRRTTSSQTHQLFADAPALP